FSCFPHVMNLACQAVITVIATHVLNNGTMGTFMDDLTDDPIGCLWILIRTICASSLHHEAFSKLAKEQFLHDLQLLCDMEVRWSSTFLMIERAIKCKPVNDFSKLCQYELNDDDWDVLEAFLDILSIPHEFQQALSSEKTLTLCDTISHFNAIIQVWKEYQDEHPETEDIIEAGIIKLQKYYDQIAPNPTYTMAMHMMSLFPCLY
ncbi:ribonuclease H-like domain-containing protein, partial [Gymnopilus junonius]